jgi:hypothetical protein
MTSNELLEHCIFIGWDLFAVFQPVGVLYWIIGNNVLVI